MYPVVEFMREYAVCVITDVEAKTGGGVLKDVGVENVAFTFVFQYSTSVVYSWSRALATSKVVVAGCNDHVADEFPKKEVCATKVAIA